jgi:RND family efflux transporter MFP subunit
MLHCIGAPATQDLMPTPVMSGAQRARLAVLSALLLGLLALGLSGCDGSQPKAMKAGPPPPPEVTVAQPVAKKIADQDEYVGRFVAVDEVEVRSRVSGYLDTVHFKDGQMVKKGDLLFTIDRRPFQAAVEQAKAALAQTKANLAFTQTDLTRAESLVERKVISGQTYDQRLQAKRVAEANVAAQEAALKQAMLDLEFTELRAPVSGRIGDRRVSPGNLVMGGTAGTTTLLATIQSTDPIRFEFTMDESSYLRYLRVATEAARSHPPSVGKRSDKAAAKGPDKSAAKGGVRDAEKAADKNAAGFADDPSGSTVRLKLIDEPEFTHRGRVDFVDNAIDRSSGTIRGRAEFPNPQGTFTPGMFGRIRMAAGPPAEALLVPDSAIGTEQARKFVLVVDQDNVAQAKYVTLGPLVDGLRVVTGLGAEDRVIVNGLMRVRPGVKVAPQSSTAEAGGNRAAN